MSKDYVPKKDELDKIATLLAERWGLDFEEKVELHRDLREGSAKVRVIRSYISDGPGFVGDIFFIVFGGGPEYHMVIGHYMATRPSGTKIDSWGFYPSEMIREGVDVEWLIEKLKKLG